MTHDVLVKLAARWAEKQAKCAIVLSDVRCGMVQEQPDVLGWTNCGFSTLIEVKVSRADFLRDSKKTFRLSCERGMGWKRYYCTPSKLVDASEVRAGWGLLQPTERGKLEVIKGSSTFAAWNERDERTLLVQATRRAMEGWGRRMFGEHAPADVVDGDAGPTTTKIIRDLRKENQRLFDELRKLRANASCEDGR
jgi:hypothetical protein